MKFLLLAATSIFLTAQISAQDEPRPNILWIVIDDMSANFSCYGETTIETPHLDALAAKGLRFTRAYATSPVCSTFRSAMITGMYQTSIGAHHHRSGRGEHRIVLPEGVVPVPKLFQEAGYFTCIGSGLPGRDNAGRSVENDKRGKTDYNFDWEPSIYDSHDWADRAEGQPFFMQVQLHGGKIRGASEKHYERLEERMEEEFGGKTDPTSVQLPPYYPRDPVLLRDWANYLDTVRITDWHIGQVMARLSREGLLENTLIVCFTDHGISHARGKQFLYDEGTHIPLIISGPDVPEGETRNDLVEHIDTAALSLAAADIAIPDSMEGKDLLSPSYRHREQVYAARDRCGEAADRIRSVRTDEFLYIKNFYPERPHLAPSQYKDSKLIIQRLRELHAEGKTNDLAETLLFAPSRPSEELYRYEEDPWQTNNLASDPTYLETLARHRKLLSNWISATGDPGPESEKVYILETEDQMSTTRNEESREQYRRNSEQYLRWAREGK